MMMLHALQTLLRGGVADNIFDWRPFREALAQVRTQTDAGHKPHVLLAMSLYEPQFTNMYALLAAALQLHGAKVSVLMDDGVLPASEKSMFLNGRHHIGQLFFDIYPIKKIFRPLGVRVFRFSEFVRRPDIQAAHRTAQTFDLKTLWDYKPDGLALGEHAMAGALRYFARGTLDQESKSDQVVRKYIMAALLSRAVTERLLKHTKIDVACFHHGIYVPQGIIGEVARQHGVRVVNWNVAYRERCFIFSHQETYHHSLMSEPVSTWEKLPLTPAIDKKITDYLDSRHHGSKDWISFNRAPQENIERICQEHKIDRTKPMVALLTNVVWDAQLHYQANVFPNMIEWVIKTIRYFIGRPDVQLIIRVHPAERKGTIPSRQPIVTEIEQAFPELPKNIIIIRPEDPTSTYVVTSLCNAAIIYGTKTGVELVTTGMPTIVAGEAWIKNKGLTIDPKSEVDYYSALNRLPLAERLDTATMERAKRYAYHFFFRRMIPVATIQPTKSIFFKLNVEHLDQLKPGADPGLDVICNGILTGSPFIYPDEQFSEVATQPTTNNYALDLR